MLQRPDLLVVDVSPSVVVRFCQGVAVPLERVPRPSGCHLVMLAVVDAHHRPAIDDVLRDRFSTSRRRRSMFTTNLVDDLHARGRGSKNNAAAALGWSDGLAIRRSPDPRTRASVLSWREQRQEWGHRVCRSVVDQVAEAVVDPKPENEIPGRLVPTDVASGATPRPPRAHTVVGLPVTVTIPAVPHTLGGALRRGDRDRRREGCLARRGSRTWCVG
jgi:hypothetical protein